MKHTMSMYQTKDAMIDAMQAEIDSLEVQLAEARKDSERYKWLENRFIMVDFNYDTGYDNITSPIFDFAFGVDVRWSRNLDELIDNSMKGGE